MGGFNISSQSMDFMRGCVLDFDLITGLSRTVPTGKRTLSQMRGMYADAQAVDDMLKDGDPVVYEYHILDIPATQGDLSFGCSILNPGKVGNEFFFTKGHFHAIEATAEVYLCLNGHGYMLLENKSGDWSAQEMHKGEAIYVPKGYAHRSINVSPDEQLVTFFVYRADAGHDYGTIEMKGYRKRIVEADGVPKVIDNMNWR